MNDKTDPTRPEDPARRAMLGTSAKAVALAAGGGFLAGCGPNAQQQTASAASAASGPASAAPVPGASNAAVSAAVAKTHVGPGELDEYYVFFSSGQSGELRIVGLPSMRELMPSIHFR